MVSAKNTVAKKVTKPPDMQLIANAVIVDGRGRVLLTQYDDDSERWWLPGSQLKAFEHPDEALNRALDGLLTDHKSSRLHHVESFRGRRGWHVMFNYLVKAGARAATAEGTWFDASALPRFSHGAWEAGVIGKVLGRG